MHTQQAIHSARQLFPRGLQQPQGSLRFGADALLLAAYAARHVEGMNGAGRNRLVAAELGCGCGAALLGLALRCPGISGLGLERELPLVQAAAANAQLLGLADRLHFAQADLAASTFLSALPGTLVGKAASLDLVLANPPYGVEGRPSTSQMRERALRGTQDKQDRKDVLHVFCRAAAALLRHQGHFFCIYDALALPQLCGALDAAGFGLRGVLPVRTHASKPALRVLVLARKNTAHQTTLEAPLTLHTRQTTTGKGCSCAPRWSAQALRFCSWLG